jgi:hypothetical protein
MKPSSFASLVSTVGLAALAVLATTAPAGAQWADKAYVSVNGGARANQSTFEDNVTFTAYAEQGDFDARYKVATAPVFDISGGVRVWHGLGLGVGVSSYSKSSPAAITGHVPHPLFFNQLRDVSGDTPALTHDEIGVHIDASWMIAASDKFDVMLFGGPSIISVKQGLVDSLNFNEVYPFDTTSLSGANAAERKTSATGFNVGADVTFRFTKMIGVGVLVRLSRAQVDLLSQDGGTVTLDLGGTNAAAGLRLRF